MCRNISTVSEALTIGWPLSLISPSSSDRTPYCIYLIGDFVGEMIDHVSTIAIVWTGFHFFHTNMSTLNIHVPQSYCQLLMSDHVVVVVPAVTLSDPTSVVSFAVQSAMSLYKSLLGYDMAWLQHGYIHIVVVKLTKFLLFFLVYIP